MDLDGPLRHRLTAAGLFALGVLFAVLGVPDTYTDVPPWLPDGRGWPLLPLAVACAASLSAPRRPLSSAAAASAAFAVDVALGGSVAVLLALGDVLFRSWAAAGAAGRRRLETAATAVVVAGTATAAVLGGSVQGVVGIALWLVAVLGVPLWWARDVARGGELARLAAEQRRRAERAAMARDLHDVVAGHVSAIALQSEAALGAARTDPGAAARVLPGIRAASVEALEEMRTMIRLMREEAPGGGSAGAAGAGAEGVATAPGLEAVPAAVALARAGGLDVALVQEPAPAAPARVPALVGQTAHRILTEALTNARKHAAPGAVTVHLGERGGALRLSVDSPLGPPPVPEAGGAGPGRAAGHGLQSMRERAEALGGRFEAGPAGGRWRVEVVLPATASTASTTSTTSTTASAGRGAPRDLETAP
ncbi:sensor histidine kinase [Kineococcus sp. SYSU DK006]|uniref:sensor histidine kinase n=1 Tax=Kineococcus sp. SYSU DK006 TaxID=3383127 RepID=UPI003D7EC731